MLKSSPELRVCADSHEQAVIFDDEYGIKKLAVADPDIKYIVDIGGNVGAATVMFQKAFPNAQIILCEPAPENMKYARLNTEEVGRVTYFEGAIVGTDEKEVTFNICDWAGNHHVDGHFRWDLFTPMGSKFNHAIKVPAMTLKDLIDGLRFPRIDLLKIDCEGLEGEILQSFKPYMSKVRHFRGEWHGDDDIPRIQDALEATHNVWFDRKFTTHGDIIADLK